MLYLVSDTERDAMRRVVVAKAACCRLQQTLYQFALLYLVHSHATINTLVFVSKIISVIEY